MRTRTPRLPPLRDDELSPEQQKLVARLQKGGGDYAIGRTFLRHPRMLAAYNALASHTFSADNTLTKRESEIVTMRTVWRVRAGYQWSRHVPMGLRAGLTNNEISSLKEPLDHRDWSDSDAALIAAVDALTEDFFVPDDVWDRLSSHFDERQCIDTIILCGRYVMAAMFVNTAGTQVDADIAMDNDLDFSDGGGLPHSRGTPDR